MIEKQMYHKLTQLFPGVLFQRIETTTGLGIPDIYYGMSNVSGWMELKQKPKSESKTITIPWRAGQYAWFRRYKFTYHILQPYILCLTIGDDWFFICDMDVKEKYSIETLYSKHYFGLTRELKNNTQNIANILFR